MICPKCGFEQPDSLECGRCGIVISRYRGPVVGAAVPAPPAFTPAAPLLSPPSPTAPAALGVGGSLYSGPEPALAAAGGTFYDGPAPVAAGGGTMFTGSMADGPIAAAGRPSFRVQGTFEVGKVLSESFSIYFSNFLPFFLLTALILSPMLVSMGMLAGSADGSDMGLALASLGLLVLSAVFCPQLATASITYGVFQQMRGRDATIGDCLGKGLSSLFPVLGLVIVQGLGIIAGVLALVIPGIILALRWSVSVPAAIEERPGVLGALRRSSYLTDGYKWTIFCILFVLNFMSQGIDKVLELALAGNQSAYLLAMGTTTVLSTGLSATATAVMYYRLRSIKESIDVDQIASVFA